MLSVSWLYNCIKSLKKCKEMMNAEFRIRLPDVEESRGYRVVSKDFSFLS